MSSTTTSNPARSATGTGKTGGVKAKRPTGVKVEKSPMGQFQIENAVERRNEYEWSGSGSWANQVEAEKIENNVGDDLLESRGMGHSFALTQETASGDEADGAHDSEKEVEAMAGQQNEPTNEDVQNEKTPQNERATNTAPERSTGLALNSEETEALNAMNAGGDEFDYNAYAEDPQTFIELQARRWERLQVAHSTFINLNRCGIPFSKVDIASFMKLQVRQTLPDLAGVNGPPYPRSRTPSRRGSESSRGYARRVSDNEVSRAINNEIVSMNAPLLNRVLTEEQTRVPEISVEGAEEAQDTPTEKKSIYDERSLQRGWAGVQSWPENEHVRFAQNANEENGDTMTRVAAGAPSGDPNDGPPDGSRDEDRGFNRGGNDRMDRRPYPQRNGNGRGNDGNNGGRGNGNGGGGGGPPGGPGGNGNDDEDTGEDDLSSTQSEKDRRERRVRGNTPFTDTRELEARARRNALYGRMAEGESRGTNIPADGYRSTPAPTIDQPLALLGTEVQDYQIAQLRQLEMIMMESITAEPGPDLPKGFKVDIPSVKYDGKDDFEALKDWAIALVTYLKLSNLVGEDRVEQHLLLAQDMFTGDAKEHYRWRYIEATKHERVQTLPMLVCELYERFITVVNVDAPDEAYEAVEYQAEHGALHFYNQLWDKARKMIVQPGEHEIKKRFIEALPPRMYADIVREDRLLPNRHKFTTWRDAAISWEIRHKVVQKAIDARKNAEVSRTAKKDTGKTAPINADKDTPKNSFRVGTGNRQVRATASKPNEATNQPRETHVSNRTPEGGPSRIARENVQPSGIREMVCYNCRKPGHKSFQCTEKPRQQMFRVGTEEDPIYTIPENEESEPESSPVDPNTGEGVHFEAPDSDTDNEQHDWEWDMKSEFNRMQTAHVHRRRGAYVYETTDDEGGSPPAWRRIPVYANGDLVDVENERDWTEHTAVLNDFVNTHMPFMNEGGDDEYQDMPALTAVSDTSEEETSESEGEDEEGVVGDDEIPGLESVSDTSEPDPSEPDIGAPRQMYPSYIDDPTFPPGPSNDDTTSPLTPLAIIEEELASFQPAPLFQTSRGTYIDDAGIANSILRYSWPWRSYEPHDPRRFPPGSWERLVAENLQEQFVLEDMPEQYQYSEAELITQRRADATAQIQRLQREVGWMRTRLGVLNDHADYLTERNNGVLHSQTDPDFESENAEALQRARDKLQKGHYLLQEYRGTVNHEIMLWRRRLGIQRRECAEEKDKLAQRIRVLERALERTAQEAHSWQTQYEAAMSRIASLEQRLRSTEGRTRIGMPEQDGPTPEVTEERPAWNSLGMSERYEQLSSYTGSDEEFNDPYDIEDMYAPASDYAAGTSVPLHAHDQTMTELGALYEGLSDEGSSTDPVDAAGSAVVEDQLREINRQSAESLAGRLRNAGYEVEPVGQSPMSTNGARVTYHLPIDEGEPVVHDGPDNVRADDLSRLPEGDADENGEPPEDDSQWIRMARAEKVIIKEEKAYRNAVVWQNLPVGNRPPVPFTTFRCMPVYMDINGLKAYMLLDTGSTAISISPEFARVANMDCFALKEQVTLFLGCVGSRSKVTFGAHGSVTLGKIQQERTYFDVVNVDRYDGIIGMAFMRKHGMAIDVANDSVRIGKDQWLPTLTLQEETTLLQERRAVSNARAAAARKAKPTQTQKADVATSTPNTAAKVSE